MHAALLLLLLLLMDAYNNMVIVGLHKVLSTNVTGSIWFDIVINRSIIQSV